MSKYKKDELAQKKQANKDGSDSEDENNNQQDFSDQQSYQAETINQMLEIDMD